MIHTPGVHEFTDLADVPNSFLGSALKFVTVNSTATGLEFTTGGGGGGTPGGADGAVQYNNGGVFAGGSLTWNESFKTLDTNGGAVRGVEFYLTGGPYTGTLNFQASSPTDDRSYVFPDASGTVALLGGFTTDEVPEGGTNLYYTDQRVEDLINSFETVNKNIKAYPATYNYTGDNITSIVYDLGGGLEVTKTLSYTGDNLTSIELSGDIPVSIDTVKTLSYTGDDLTAITYS